MLDRVLLGVNHPGRRESTLFKAPLPTGHLGSTHQLLRGAPSTLPIPTIRPGVTAVSLILPDQLFLLNSKVGHNSCAPLTMWTGGVVRRKAGTSRHSVQNNRPAFSSQSLLHWHQPVWWPGFEARFQNKALHGRSCIHMGGVKQRLNPSPRNQPILFPFNHLHVSGSHFPHSHGPFCPCSCPCSPRSLFDIAFVTRRRRCGQMGGRRPEKQEAYSLEYIEDFSWPRTTKMVADRSPQ